MSSVDEITNLIYEYYHRMDLGNYEGVASLYGETAQMRDGVTGASWTGKDETFALWKGLVKIYDGIPLTKHCVTNVVVDVDEDAGTASAKCYVIEFQATEHLPLQPVIVGRWYDELERADGKWRFKTRTWFSDLVGNLSAHLNPAALDWWEEGAEASRLS
jgi:hypothetical protein